MKDFGRWFSDFTLPEIMAEVEMLPEGVWERRPGEYLAECCVCGRDCELPCRLEEIPQVGYRHYGNCGPHCCP